MRLFALALLSWCVFVDSSAFAQGGKEPLDLVRGLRNNGLPDLALEYLDEIKKVNKSPEVTILFPLEYARTWLELATIEPEEAKRATLVANAKREIEVFINANPKHPQTAQANVELARLLSLQGKLAVSRARRIEDPGTQKGEMDRARAELKNASDKYAATVGFIEGEIKKADADQSPAGLKVRKELGQFRLKSMIDQGINLFLIGDTYGTGDSEDQIKGGDQFKAAKKIFEKVMFQDDKEPLCWVARAWAAECDYRSGDESAGMKAYMDLLGKKVNFPASAAGIRQARYFGILHPINPKEKTTNPFARAERDASEWLRDYHSFRNSEEGVGARFYLAFARFEQGKTGVLHDKDNKITGITPTAKGQFEEAQKGFKDLAETENPYMERATRYRSQILVTVADAEGHGDAPPPETLGNFEKCYLMAQVQVARFVQYKQLKLSPPKKTEAASQNPNPKKDAKADPKKDAKAEPKKEIKAEPKKEEKANSKKEPEETDPNKLEELIKKEETRRFKNAIAYLEFGLQVATPKDPAREVFAAQFFLVKCYYHMKMYQQGGILAEFVARSNPKMSQAPLVGSTAIQCYRNSYSKLLKAGEARQKYLQADAAQLRHASQFMVEKFPAEVAADDARQTLAFFYFNMDKNSKEAWKYLADIKNSYPAVQSARRELADAMISLIRPDEQNAEQFNKIVMDRIREYSEKGNHEMWQRTMALLQATPQPVDGCQVYDAVSYLDGRAQYIRLCLLAHDYNKAMPLADLMVKSVGKYANLTPQQKTNYSLIAEGLALSSVRGMAYDHFKQNNHAKVAEILNPRIEAIQKTIGDESKADMKSFQNLRQIQKGILVLALQSAVQDQKIDRAGEILDILEKMGGSVESSLGLLKSLVVNVRNQIEELDGAGKKDESANLKKGFSTLLDRIKAKGDKVPNNMKMFISQGYQSVDAYTQAGELLDGLSKIKGPTKPEPLKADASDEEKANFDKLYQPWKTHDTFHHQVQFALARNYHMAGKAAPTGPGKLQELNKALGVLNGMIGVLGPKEKTIPKDKRGWGYASMEVRRERALVMEEIARATIDTTKAAKWGQAVQEWVQILQQLLGRELPSIPNILTQADNVAIAKEKDSKKKAELKEKLIAEREKELTPEQRAKRSTEITNISAKRNLWYELWFESKRCSVDAYVDLGPSATKGDKGVYESKFAKFAQDFHDFTTKNKDVPQSVKDKIQKLIEKTPLLKQEYKKVAVQK